MTGSLPSRRFCYMTARCPQGCGWWSIPAAVTKHVRQRRCTGVPWPELNPRSVLVAAGTRTALLRALPDAVKQPPVFGDRAVDPLRRDRRLARRARTGVVVVSPLPEVGARRWLETVALGVERFGTRAAERAVTAEGFTALEAQIGPIPGFVLCGGCGEWQTHRGIANHRATNTRCRWLVAHRAVEAAWADGWRDPWSQPAVPVRWAELAHGRWSRFVRLVEYPQWTAVLVDPAQRLRRRGSSLAASGVWPR
jgi:hypothetical protein